LESKNPQMKKTRKIKQKRRTIRTHTNTNRTIKNNCISMKYPIKTKRQKARLKTQLRQLKDYRLISIAANPTMLESSKTSTPL